MDAHNNIISNMAFPGEVTLTLPYTANSSFGGNPVAPHVSSAYDYAVFFDNGG